MLGSVRKNARFLPVLLLSLTTFACSAEEPQTDNGPPPPEAEDDEARSGAERIVAEADIVQVKSDRLYAMSKSGSLAVLDISTPGRLALLGKTRLPGEPFEMYLRGNQLVTMSKFVFQWNGTQSPIEAESRYPRTSSRSSSAVVVIDVSNPGNLERVANHVVPGVINDSRVVGDVLYIVSTQSGSCYRCETTQQTHVTSFSLTDAIDLPKVDDLVFAPPNARYAGWSRSVSVGKDRLYIGGHDTRSYASTSGEIDVVDISDPGGRLVRGAHLEVPGAIQTRWQVDERDDLLRVVSQPSVGASMPELNTFAIESSQKITPLGHMTMSIPKFESLRGVRFDRDRAYVITFRTEDPFFVIDLSNPKEPRQRGELHIPGYVFHMEPFGDRVLGLGVDTKNDDGNINVSLFDVSDMDNPRMLQRVAFGGDDLRGNDATAYTQLAEDSDRIQKAFRVLDDGLVVVPFSGTAGFRSTGDTCKSEDSGVQLIEWKGDTLTKRAHLPLQGNPRRAIPNKNELITVSDSHVRTFSLANKDEAQATGDVVIGECVPRYGQDLRRGWFCTAHVPGRGTSDVATMGILVCALGFVIARRKRA